VNQERLDVARKTLQTAIQLDPNLSVAHERLGYCHWLENQLTDAAMHYTRAIELDPKNSRAHFGLGGVRMTQYLNDPGLIAFRDEAVEAWHRSLEIDPDQPKVRELIEKYRVKNERPPLATQR
jgi:tetratricopeptide (TPR) repeat protein